MLNSTQKGTLQSSSTGSRRSHLRSSKALLRFKQIICCGFLHNVTSASQSGLAKRRPCCSTVVELTVDCYMDDLLLKKMCSVKQNNCLMKKCCGVKIHRTAFIQTATKGLSWFGWRKMDYSCGHIWVALSFSSSIKNPPYSLQTKSALTSPLHRNQNVPPWSTA